MMAAKQALDSVLSTPTISPEYETMCECCPKLVTLIQQSPSTIGNALFARHFLAPNVRNFVNDRMVSETVRAQRLVDTLTDRIQHFPDSFNDFLQILEKEGPWTSDMVKELRDLFRAKGGCVVELSSNQNAEENDGDSKGPPSVDASSEDSFHSTTDQPESTHRQPGFVCLCGECSSEHLFSEKGCPKAEQKTSFPFLDVSNLGEADKIDLEHRLLSDTNKMGTKFASFTLFLEKSLEDQEVPLQKVASCVLSLPAYTEDIGKKLLAKKDKEAIQQAESVSKIFMVLQSHTSFFNYEIMEHLVRHHGSPDDHKRLVEYLTAFNTFCQRSVFEVPPNVYSSKSRTDCKVFAVKCTERVATTLEGVRGVRGKIADVLGLTPSSLQLCSVVKGCMELRFLISTAVADRILPVPPAKQRALNEIGVRVLVQGKDERFRKIPEDQLRYT